MILHSVVPSGIMQQMLYEQDTSLPPIETVNLANGKAVTGCYQNGRFVVGRIYSTDPNDFLTPDSFIPFLPPTQF